MHFYEDLDTGSCLPITYDAASNMTQRNTLSNNTYVAFPRDNLNRPTNRNLYAGSTQISGESYAYVPMGWLGTVQRTEDNKLDAYGYDYSGQLTAASFGWTWNGTQWVSPTHAVNFTFDLVGNRTQSVSDATTTTYTTNILNQYGTVSGQTIGNGSEHEIGSYQGATFSYINDGQLQSVSGTVSGTAHSYGLAYDAFGRTVKRNLDGAITYSYYQGANPIQEAGATSATNFFGPGSDEIIIRYEPTNVKYFYQDRLGSVTHVRNGSGTFVETYRYDAYGQPTIKNSSGVVQPASQIGNRFMFTGREYNNTFGFYEYRARAYSPQLGRFMSEDPSGFGGGDGHLFRYCGNNSMNGADPSGMIPRRADTSGLTHGGHTAREGGGESTLGDMLDIGGGDNIYGGAATDVTGIQGYDGDQVSGVALVQAEGTYSLASYSAQRAMGGFGGFLAIAQTFGGAGTQYLVNAGNSPLAMATAGGMWQLSGLRHLPSRPITMDVYGLGNGWSGVTTAAGAAIDQNSHAHMWPAGDGIEIGGSLFKNSDGTWGYTVIDSRLNSSISCTTGLGDTSAFGFTALAFWHIHPGAPNTSPFNPGPNDAYLGLPNYYGLPNGAIDMVSNGNNTPVHVRAGHGP